MLNIWCCLGFSPLVTLSTNTADARKGASLEINPGVLGMDLLVCLFYSQHLGDQQQVNTPSYPLLLCSKEFWKAQGNTKGPQQHLLIVLFLCISFWQSSVQGEMQATIFWWCSFNTAREDAHSPTQNSIAMHTEQRHSSWFKRFPQCFHNI